MEIKKLSFVDLSILAVLIVACAYAWNVSRNAALNGVTFQAPRDVVVYREKAIAKAEAIPKPNVTAIPLPIVPPSVIYQVMPEFPASVKSGGALILRALVSASGNIDRVEVKLSSGNGSLDGAAASAISKWKFAPAKRGTEAIASWYEIPVEFKIQN